MNLNDYQKIAESTMRNDTTIEMLKNFGLGITGEAGEVADYIKKITYHDHSIDNDKLAKELGDVLWYIATISSAVGLNLDYIAKTNINKLKERYPNGFSCEDSINRKC